MRGERRILLVGRWAAVCWLLLLAALLLGRPAVGQEPALPAAPPDAEAGLPIFAERCASCHGPTGGGDGEMAAQFPNRPAAFNAPDYRQTALPADLFNTITHGRLERGMPPFGPASSNTISEADRWNLVATIFSLSTPGTAVAEGQAVYETSCQACHGTAGQGDGPEAAADPAPTDLTRLDYWFNRSNETVFAALENGRIPQHNYHLSDDERRAVVDYARTFSYAYVDLFAPIEQATVRGQVVNGTTGAVVGETTARLRAFTTDLQPTLDMTTTVDIEGQYQFDLTDVPPNLVYLVGVQYNGLNFTSDVIQLTRSEPDMALPVTVYETTADPGVVTIDQVHLILDFVSDRVQVSELYIFSNQEAAVFVGTSGEPAQGTVEMLLPTGAENVAFQRTFGSVDSFLPANEVIQTAEGWADTLPLRPGAGGTSLLVRYDLPYRSGMSLAHPLRYDTGAISAVMPAVGVTIAEQGEWLAQGTQSTAGGSFLSYRHPGLPAGSALSLTLNGRPQQVTDASGNTLLVRDQTTELVLGGAALLLVVGAAVYLMRQWTAGEDEEEDDEAFDDTAEADTLLRAIAELDTAYENGELEEAAYTRQRARLKAQLTAVWPTG